MNKVLTMGLASPADLDEVCNLCSLVVRQVPQCGWTEEYPNRQILQQDISSGTLYKIYLEDEFISMMHICPWSEYVQGEETLNQGWNEGVKNPCAMGRFCVTPALQGQGYGRKCMQKSLEKAKELGYDGVRFHAVVDNPIACHLYQSMGFHNAGRIHEFGKDFVCFEKML